MKNWNIISFRCNFVVVLASNFGKEIASLNEKLKF